MAIRYKVTTLDNYSAMVTKREAMRHAHLQCVYYRKSAIIIDKKGIGFFCFKTKADAQFFIQRFTRKYKHKIKRVQTLSRGTHPKIPFPPSGTICYKKIKVLD